MVEAAEAAAAADVATKESGSVGENCRKREDAEAAALAAVVLAKSNLEKTNHSAALGEEIARIRSKSQMAVAEVDRSGQVVAHLASMAGVSIYPDEAAEARLWAMVTIIDLFAAVLIAIGLSAPRKIHEGCKHPEATQVLHAGVAAHAAEGAAGRVTEASVPRAWPS